MIDSNNNYSDLIFYNSPDGNVKVEVLYYGDTFWLSQKRMAELFGVEVAAVSKHLANIFESEELIRLELFPFWKQFKSKERERSNVKWNFQS